MPDYGHELAFGTFVTPQAERPDDVVALALTTEEAGLDLVSFQDHPYQPAFLDTWTLLTWVAARTSTVRLAPNVLNVPLRPPAVLGRAAASLDRLSGGRLELGLGAGAFWDGIEAMGGTRLRPGEAVDALAEAIEVIRGVWDVGRRGGVRVDGAHHRVRGARRGPPPAHDIPIWVGAYKPRMLRLTGRMADGWLPSLAYLPPTGFAAANAAIDAAAAEAGRDPREVRRLLNVNGAFLPSSRGLLQGPPRQWAEELTALAREHGFSTFILAADDPASIEMFGREVAPAVREAVARERESAGTLTGPARGPAAVALRRPGIDYDALPRALAADAVEPGDRPYGRLRSTYVRTGTPGLILRPAGPEQVAQAVAFARGQDVPLAIRSGGHGISGRSTNDGGIVIDLARLDTVEVLDPSSGRVRLGPGARWGEVARELAPHGLGMSSGDYGDVGVGGLVTAGGIGFLARRHGLTIDHVVAAELVLADGSLVRTDAGHEPDLFWAVRGAGANFGVLTAVELEAYPVGDVVFAQMSFDGTDAAGLLVRWGEVLRAAPRELTSFLNLFSRAGSAVAQLYSVYAGDDAQAAVEALTPLLDIAPLTGEQASLLPYPAVMAPHGGVHLGSAPQAFRCGLLERIAPEAGRLLEGGLRTGATPWLQIRSVGGAVNDVHPSATAYAHRHQHFVLSAVTPGSREDRLDALWSDMRPHLDGLYLSFDTDRRPERLHDAFPGETLTRLRRLKARYDPEQVFDQNFPIPPEAAPPAEDAAAR